MDGEVRSPSFNSIAPSSPSSDVMSNCIATPKIFSQKRKMSPSYAVLSLVSDRLQDLGKKDMLK
jgi:predicted metallopeptidase